MDNDLNYIKGIISEFNPFGLVSFGRFRVKPSIKLLETVEKVLILSSKSINLNSSENVDNKFNLEKYITIPILSKCLWGLV